MFSLNIKKRKRILGADETKDVFPRVILIMSERLRVERILNAFETKESRDTVKCEELTQDQDTDSALK